MIWLVALVTTLPDSSSMVTAGWVPQAVLSAPPPGWALKTSWDPGPKVIVKVLLVTVVKPVAAAVRV